MEDDMFPVQYLDDQQIQRNQIRRQFLVASQLQNNFQNLRNNIQQIKQENVINNSNNMDQQQDPNEGMGHLFQMLSSSVDRQPKKGQFITFLEKIQKHNTSSKTRKINANRVINLDIFLQCTIKQMPKTPKQPSFVYQLIIAFLNNPKNFIHDEESYELHHLLNTIATFLEASVSVAKQAQPHYVSYVLKMIRYLIYGKLQNYKIMTSSQLAQQLNKSDYFINFKLPTAEQIHQHSLSNQDIYSQQYSLLNPLSKENILQFINITQFYKRLVKIVDKEDKKKAIDYFIQNVKLLEEKSLQKIKMFNQAFIKEIQNNPQQIQAVIYGIQSQIFDLQQMNDLIKSLILQIIQKYSVGALSSIKLKGLKCQQIFMQIAMKQCGKLPIQTIISNFLENQSVTTYFLLYIIVKSQKPIPYKYTKIIFDDHDKPITYRKAIILALALLSNNNCVFKLIDQYQEKQSSFSNNFKSSFLKVVHFCLQKISKVILFTKILKLIPPSDLNKETTLQFFPSQPLQKMDMQKQQCKALKQFIKKNFDNSQQTFKIKVDIYSLCGQQMPLLMNIKTVIAHIDKSTDDLLKDIHNSPQQILDATLMALNNKLQQHYIQDVSINTIEWIIKTYNKNWQLLKTKIKSYLAEKGLEKLSSLTYSVLLYNQFKNTAVSIDQGLQPVLNGKSIRMKGVQVSEYYIQLSKLESKIQQIVKIKGKITQLRTLLQYLISFQQKFGNRKDVKCIIMNGAQNIFTLQIIHHYLTNKLYESHPNLNILEKVFLFKDSLVKIQQNDLAINEGSQMFRSQVKFLQELQKKAQEINQDYFSIYNHLPKLLNLLYPQTLNYTSNLLKSQPSLPSEQMNSSKKSKGKKKKMEAQKNMIMQSEKILQILLLNIGAIYKDASLLTNYNNLLTISEKLIAYVNLPTHNMKPPVNQKGVAYQIAKWLQGIKMFHQQNFKIWQSKVQNITTMWARLQPIFDKINHLQQIIGLQQLQRHFLMFVDYLNTLYEKFRSQSNMLDIQQKILITMYIIYRLSSNCKQQRLKQDYLQEQTLQLRQIPKSQIQNSLRHLKVKNLQPQGISSKEMRYYQCHTCQRSICQLCSNFIHRVHDRTYIGLQGSCIHDQLNASKKLKNNKIDDPNAYLKQKIKAMKSSNQSGLFSFGYRRDGGQQLSSDILAKLQKYQILQQLQRQQNESLSYRAPRRDDLSIQNLVNQRLGLRLDRQTSIINRQDQTKKSLQLKKNQSQDQQQDKISIKSASQKSFQTYLFKNSDNQTFKPSFGIHQFLNKTSTDLANKLPNSPIDLSPLSNLLIRQLQNQMFHCSQVINQSEKQSLQKKSKDKAKQKMIIPSVDIVDNRIQFFRTNSLRWLTRDNPYGGRGMYAQVSGSRQYQIKNILTSNKKYLVIAVPASVFIMNLTEIKKRYLKKELAKNINNSINCEPQNQLKTGTISGLNFEVMQAVFSEYNEQMLALIGQNQISFYHINQQGKPARYLAQDFQTSASITKFTWINQAKLSFAFAAGKEIRIGMLQSNNKVRKLSQITVSFAIRDFSIFSTRKMFTLFVLDTEGNIYRECFSYKSEHINLSSKIMQFQPNINNPSSILAFKSKLIISNISNEIFTVQMPNINIQKQTVQTHQQRLRKVVGKEAFRIKKFSIFQKLKQMNQLWPSLASLSYPISLKLMSNSSQSSQYNSFTLACILKRDTNYKSGHGGNNSNNSNPYMKRVPGVACVLQFKDTNSLHARLFNPQIQIDSYDFSPLDQSSYLYFGFQQQGVLTTTRYSLPQCSFIKNQDLKVNISTNQAMLQFNQIIKDNSYINKLAFTDTNRCIHFKDKQVSKNVTDKFTVISNTNNVNIQNLQNHFTFISGLCFEVQPQLEEKIMAENQKQKLKESLNSKEVERDPIDLAFNFLGIDYIFKITKSRQIQLGLTLKQSLFLFTNKEPVFIQFKNPIHFKVKKVQIYGQEWQPTMLNLANLNPLQSQKNLIDGLLNPFISLRNEQNNGLMIANNNPLSTTPSVYRQCILKLKKLYEIYVSYPIDSVQHYFLNAYRIDLPKIKVSQIVGLLQSKGYGTKQINLLLKIEIFAQSLPSSSIKYSSNKVSQIIQLSKQALLTFCQSKTYLENSCQRLMKVLSGIYNQKSSSVPKSMLVQKIGHPFQSRTIIDLFFMQKYYNSWKKSKSIISYEKFLKCLQNVLAKRVYNFYIMILLFPSMIFELSGFFKTLSSEIKSFPSAKRQVWKKKISEICNNLITIVCENYQILKNYYSKAKGQTYFVQRFSLQMLENIFCLIKKDFYKDVLLNPFQHLQKLYISESNIWQLDVGINVHQVKYLGRQQSNQDKDKQKNAQNHLQALKQNQSLQNGQQDQIQNQQMMQVENPNQNFQVIGQRRSKDSGNQQNVNQDQDVFQQQRSWEQQRQLQMEVQEQRQMKRAIISNQISLNRQQSSVHQQQVKVLSGNNNRLKINKQANKQKQIVNQLMLAFQNTDPNKKLVFQSYPMVFQLAASLFAQSNYITQSNAVFYMGLLFNLLRIIEMRIDSNRDRQKIYTLCQKIDKAIEDKSNSPLFMVLSTFIQPDYYVTRDNMSLRRSKSLDKQYTQQQKQLRVKQKEMKFKHHQQFYRNCRKIVQKQSYAQSKPTRICNEIIKFYKENPNFGNPILKIKQLNIQPKSQSISLNEALVFTSFKTDNGIYNLKYLGNLYISLKRSKYLNLSQQHPSQSVIKSLILSTIIKNDLRVFKNIMIYQGWQNDLQKARVDVGFQRIYIQNEGVNMLYDSAINHREIFINTMNQERINVLEEMIINGDMMDEKDERQDKKGEKNSKKNQKILQILDMYYEYQSKN